MTYVNDPIGDFLTRMRNAQSARRKTCSAPWSRIKEELCAVLKKEGWIEDIAITGEMPKKEIEVTFVPGKRLDLERVSKPGRRVYAKAGELNSVLHGYGIAILTTSEGLITDREARKRNLGGELLCTIS